MLTRLPNDVSTQILVFLKMAGVDIGSLHLVFGLPPDVVAATLGDVGIQEVVTLATGVSRSILVSSLRVITFYFSSRSLTTWPLVLTGVSRSATSRGVNKPRPSNNPGSMETLSRDNIEEDRKILLPVPRRHFFCFE